MRAIYDVICKKAPCNMLVFGLGDDSPVWAATNTGGYTLFIEDDAEWIDRIIQRDSALNVYHHTYTSTRRNWEQLLSSSKKLLMDIPASILERDWDIILVDAPAGYKPDLPGRMQSIYTAATLATPGTDVFVHDVDRPVEDTYSREFLGAAEQVQEVDRLRHYRVTPR
jgi:glucuronoxylan 4-O-methyltransferase